MGKYIHFTEAEKEQARNIDLVSFLEGRGEQLRRCGSEYVWPERHITIRGNVWYDQYTQEGGNAVDFAMREYGLSFQGAVAMLIGKDDGTEGFRMAAPPRVPLEQRRAFALPDRYTGMRRVYAYLVKTRGIDADVVSHFASCGLIYEEAKYHNAVFVGTDEHGNARHAHKRSTLSLTSGAARWNAAGSDAAFAFSHAGTSPEIFAFEAPIDMLSYISMNKRGWQEKSYVSLCSVSGRALFRLLEAHQHLKAPVACTDNDDAGREAAGRMIRRLAEAGYEGARAEVPHLKDWNDDLLALRAADTKTKDTEIKKEELEVTVWQGMSLA
jgi:hypothetical protein